MFLTPSFTPYGKFALGDVCPFSILTGLVTRSVLSLCHFYNLVLKTCFPAWPATGLHRPGNSGGSWEMAVMVMRWPGTSVMDRTPAQANTYAQPTVVGTLGKGGTLPDGGSMFPS